MSDAKPKTFFIDIDGVIFEHLESGAWNQWQCRLPAVLSGVSEFFDEIEAKSAIIILVTARKESERARLVDLLAQHGVFYDQLIMGVSSGERVLINDAKPSGEKSCFAIEVKRNEGLKCLLGLF